MGIRASHYTAHLDRRGTPVVTGMIAAKRAAVEQLRREVARG